MSTHDHEFAYLCELNQKYPPVLSVKMVAEILKEDVPTVRARIRRGSFPIPVRQETGGRQYVLLAELVHFVFTGPTQPQHDIFCAIDRPAPRRRGRPSKADQIKSMGVTI